MRTRTVIAVAVLTVAGGALAIATRRAWQRPPAQPASPGPVLNAPSLRTASTHPMQYYVSLPSGWSRARSWPVVVAIPGSDRNWLAHANAFAAMRDARGYPFIVITPVVLTIGGRDLRHSPEYAYAAAVWDHVDREGRCPFDMDGLRAVVADVTQEYGGEARVFLTGFSGGGHPAIAYTLVHPERLRAVALSAGNYIGRCVRAPTAPTNPEVPEPIPAPPISNAIERVTLPVRFFNGTDDPNWRHSIPQRDRAMSDLATNLFANVSSVMIPNVRHDPMIGLVLDYFHSVLATTER